MPIKVKTQYSSLFSDGDFKIESVNELNFFDLLGEKAKTRGTSNKSYRAELCISHDGTLGQIFTMYGATGGTQSKDYRHYCPGGNAEKGIGDLSTIKKDYEKILASKRKKGYKDIDVAVRALGSDAAKKIVKPLEITEKPAPIIIKSSINDSQKQIIDIFFGAQDQFVAETLKCPLGQLTNKQIDDGRMCLDAAKKIVNNTNISDSDRKQLLELTNDFYGLIPHNLGSGARGQMSHLLLDDLNKIVAKESDLDTLLDAKNVSTVLSINSDYDSKYKSLNADFEGIAKGSELFGYLSQYFEDTKVRQHGYDSARVKRIWKLNRLDEKEKAFNKTIQNISKEKMRNIFVSSVRDKLKNAENYSYDKRPDLTQDERDSYNSANVWMCWHGTRSANLVGITRRGLLIRPSGAIHTGSLYGDGKYFAWQSSKSLNYCSGGYWTGGKESSHKYMFVLDTAFGKMYRQDSPKFFSSAPSGYHSVYSKGGNYLKNDEVITYDYNDTENQSRIKYIVEVS